MVEPLTDAEITELRKLESEATPPPWWNDRGDLRAGADRNLGEFLLGVDAEDVPSFDKTPDAALVAAVRNALPRLLDEIEELRAYRREMMER